MVTMPRSDGVRPPVQERSRKTYDALIAAGRKLLNDQSFSRVTIQDIVEEAGSSAGSFYARFEDKLAFLCAVQHHVNEDIRDRMAKFSASEPRTISLEDMAKMLTTGLVFSHKQDPGLARAMLTEAADAPNLAAEAKALMDEVSTMMAPFLDLPATPVDEVAAGLTDAQSTVMAVLHTSLFDGGLAHTPMPEIFDDGRLTDVFIAATGLR